MRLIIVTLLLLVMLLTSVRTVPAAPQIPLNYQGRLLDSQGAPVPDDSYTIVCSIYDAESGGNLLWGPVTKDVKTNNGLFNVQLDGLDPSAFPGVSWLSVSVNGQVMSRQQIGGAGYAFHALLADGLVFGGSISGSGGTIGFTVNNYKAANAIGIVGLSTGTWASPAYQFGVFGRAGTWSHGYPTVAAGVCGVSSAGYGVYARSDTAGLYAAGGTGPAIVADGQIQILASSPSPPLVVSSNARVPDLNADLLDGNHASSFATVTFTDSSYVRRAGDTMTGTLSVPDINYTPAQTSYLSISACDFSPENESLDFTRSPEEIYLNSGTTGVFIAPVRVPHGSIIRRITFYWTDGSATADIDFRLVAAILSTGGSYNHLSERSSGSSGEGETTHSGLNISVNCNTTTLAIVAVVHAAGRTVNAVRGVVIEYTYTRP